MGNITENQFEIQISERSKNLSTFLAARKVETCHIPVDDNNFVLSFHDGKLTCNYNLENVDSILGEMGVLYLNDGEWNLKCFDSETDLTLAILNLLNAACDINFSFEQETPFDIDAINLVFGKRYVPTVKRVKIEYVKAKDIAK